MSDRDWKSRIVTLLRRNDTNLVWLVASIKLTLINRVIAPTVIQEGERKRKRKRKRKREGYNSLARRDYNSVPIYLQDYLAETTVIA